MNNPRKNDHDRMERQLAPKPGHPKAKSWGFLLVGCVHGRAKEYIAFTWPVDGDGKWHHFNRRDWALGWLHLNGCTHYKEQAYGHIFDLDRGRHMMGWLRNFNWPRQMRRIPKRVREGRY